METFIGGGKRDRTADPLLAGQVLYQLSYAPTASVISSLFIIANLQCIVNDFNAVF